VVEAFPSGVPRTSRSWNVVETSRRAGLVRDGTCTLSRCAFFVVVSRFVLFIIGCGYPYSAGTDSLETIEHVRCVTPQVFVTS
jgi:hypothetical protein